MNRRFWMKLTEPLMIGCFLAGMVWAAETSPLLEQLNQVSRDIHTSQKAGQSREDKAAAFSKESSSAESLKRMVSGMNSPEETRKAIETLRQFSYRISTSAEKKTFQQTTLLLESRLKFLSQSEGSSFLPLLDSLESLSNEVDAKKVSLESGYGGEVRKIATQSRSSAPRSASGLLGAQVSNGVTTFAVYAPEATELNVILFEKAADKAGKGYTMQKGNDGVWRCSINGELYGKYYGYSADGPKGPGYLFDPNRLLSDPCALANVDHDGKSLIVKTDFTWTDRGFKTPAAKDLIVYEMHVKDYTAHASSGVTGNAKGKYLGLLEGKGTGKVLGNLVELGVNAVELLPCQEFDNNFAGHMNHWGYMTSHYFAPECAFASGKNGEGVKEFKQMVDGLHKAGIAVIMDVVYNHTAEGNEKGVPLNFRGLDNPGYYRLMDDRRYYWNGTGCGNEFRSDNPMTRKYIVDSLKYWVRDYHVDGFRFDLGTILDKETMNAILTELPAQTIIVAEPWAADWKRNQWGKTDFRNTKLGKWNDDFREKARGFMRGEADRNELMTVIAGSCFWWTAKPTESVNYIECHDGAVVNDLYKGDKARLKLGAAVLLTSQGIPMIHEGQEFMKTKKGNDNSYDQDNDINWINWAAKEQNNDMFQFYRGLISLRKKYENFKHATAMNNQHISWLQPGNQRGLGYHLKGDTDFLVLLNSDSNDWITFQLPDANEWKIVGNGDKIDDVNCLGTAKGDYRVPPLKAIILKNR